MANSIIEQSAQYSTFVLKLNNSEWGNFSTLFQLITQLNSLFQSKKRNDEVIIELMDNCKNNYTSLKANVIDKVKRCSSPCSKLLCFNQAGWIALNEYFVISCCIAHLLSQFQQKQCDISATIIEDYLKRFKGLEEKIYTAYWLII